MANLIELGVACDGLGFDYDGWDGILQVLMLEMRSPLNLDSSLLDCENGDL